MLARAQCGIREDQGASARPLRDFQGRRRVRAARPAAAACAIAAAASALSMAAAPAAAAGPSGRAAPAGRRGPRASGRGRRVLASPSSSTPGHAGSQPEHMGCCQSAQGCNAKPSPARHLGPWVAASAREEALGLQRAAHLVARGGAGLSALRCSARPVWRRGAHRQRLDARVGGLHERRERVLHLAQVEDELRPHVVGEERDVVAEEAVEATLAAEARAEALGRHLLRIRG